MHAAPVKFSLLFSALVDSVATSLTQTVIIYSWIIVADNRKHMERINTNSQGAISQYLDMHMHL